MKTKIISEKENPFLERKEIKIEIEHTKECTPSKAQLQQLLSKELKNEVEYIDVRSIFSDYGKSFSLSKVFIWNEKKVSDLSKPKKETQNKKEEIKKNQETQEQEKNEVEQKQKTSEDKTEKESNEKQEM